MIFKAIFGVFSLIGSFFRIKKAVKLTRKTVHRIKKKCEKRRIKKEKLEAKGFPKLKKYKKLVKLRRLKPVAFKRMESTIQ